MRKIFVSNIMSKLLSLNKLFCCDNVFTSFLSQKWYQKHSYDVKQLRTIVFMSLTGDTLMTLVNVCKHDKWSNIIKKISMETWYKTSKRWSFNFGIRNLKPNDVLDSNDELITITCIKIVPMIIFESEDGEILVSVPFESCRSEYTNRVTVFSACYEAHKKLKELGNYGYGTNKTMIQPFIDTYMHGGQEFPTDDCLNSYVFYINETRLELNYTLDDPENDGLTIVAVPILKYCTHCAIEIYGPWLISEQKHLYDRINICSVCRFLHCPSCGKYKNYTVGTFMCHANRNM